MSSNNDDDDKEPPQSFSDYSHPLSEDQIRKLQPALARLAYKYSRCEADRDDLVQTAMLALVDGRRNWTNALVCAESAMKDAVKTATAYAWWTAVPMLPAGYNVPDPITEEEVRKSLQNFDGLGLSESDRAVAVLHFVEGVEQQHIGGRLGIATNEVYCAIRRVRKAVRKKYITCDDDEPNGGDGECDD